MTRSGARRRGSSLVETWGLLNGEQRLAAVASALVIVSTLGPFSFVEAAELLTAVAVLALLKLRADRRAFHLPFGDGVVILGAGVWCGLLIVARMFDRPPGQTALALLCATLLAVAGLREHAKRAPDDLPEEPAPARGDPSVTPAPAPRADDVPRPPTAASAGEPTAVLPAPPRRDRSEG